MEILEAMIYSDRLKQKGCQGLHINKENKFSSTRKGLTSSNLVSPTKKPNELGLISYFILPF